MGLHKLSRLNDQNAKYVAQHYCCMPEADSAHNDMQRRIVAAVQEEYGEAWLGLINRYGDEQNGPPIWQWDGGIVYNFGADFVLPHHDMKLEILLRQREEAPYTGTSDDATRIKAITVRVEVCRGYHLIWT